MSLPYFPMFPTDFEAKTSHLTLAEDGAYNRLLRLMWMTPGCTLPADDDWIKRRMRVDQSTYDEVVRVVIDEFFTVENGRLSNAKLGRIFAETSEAHKKRVSAGSKGGKSKALKTNNSGSSNAVAKPKQPEPKPEPYKKEETNVSCAPSPANDLSEAVSIYNDAAEQAGWPKVQKLTPSRAKSLRARLHECGGLDGWRAAMSRSYRSDFCREGWKGFGFDSLVSQQKFTRLMEGNYDNRTSNTHGPANGPQNRTDPALEQIARLARSRPAPGYGSR